MTENQIAKIVLDKAFRVHRELGPGLLESVYEKCLHYELIKAGYACATQIPISVNYQDRKIEGAYRADMLVEEKVLIEIKSVEALNELHFAQTLTYVKLGGFKLGLLINFNTTLLKQGLRRVVNGLEDKSIDVSEVYQSNTD